MASKVGTSAVDLIQRTNVLGLYKNLFKNLRSVGLAVNTNNYVEILRNEFRQNSVSDSKYCMKKNELYFLANAYATYLDSTNETLRLYNKYCKGERSIEDSANKVGLRLPKQYEPNEKK